MRVELNEADVVWRELEGEVIILNLATGCYYGLEGSANDMWRLLLQHGTTDKVIEILADDYEVERDRVTRDVDDLVRRLCDKSILKTAAA